MEDAVKKPNKAKADKKMKKEADSADPMEGGQ